MNPLEQAIDLYEHMKGEPVVNVREQLGDVPVLTPQEIGTFYAAVISQGQTAKPDYVTGPFIDALLQKSYDNGHNGFVLEGDAPWLQLANGLRGNPKDHLKITIPGSVKTVGFRASDIVITVGKVYHFKL